MIVYLTWLIKHLILISGPTASGKTALSISLAKHFNTCVLSADSRQFYKEISIGTAKPSVDEMDGVKHYFIDSHSITEEITAGNYEEQGLKILETEFKSKNVIILTGGSGMYIDALCNGLDKIPTDRIIREQLQKELDTNGLKPLLEELKMADIDFHKIVDQQNPRRILRALEVTRSTGKTFTSYRNAKSTKRPFQVHRFAIDHERESLYNRINLRVDLMMYTGLLNEVKSVINHRNLTSMNTVGYKELFLFIDGTIKLEDAVLAIKQNSRRYAKRQITWIKRHTETQWIKWTNTDEMTSEILSYFSKSINLE